MSTEKIIHTELYIKDKNTLRLNGVTNVDSFDTDFVALSLSDGKVSAEGQGLKIISLTKESGEIEISGRITGIFYSDVKKKEKSFKKLFG